uniref:hypothetical protein n=1 Tax=Kiloniella sp. TaxID=1938587 RepID=UPI003B01B9AD
QISTVTNADLTWAGPLDTFLNKWVSAYGYDWSYDGNRINVERYRASLFSINALAGTDTFTTNQSSATTGDNSSLSGQTLSFQHSIDSFSQLEEQIKALVGPETNITVSRENASVSVRGTPFDVKRVKNYLQHASQTTLRSISFAVNIIDIEKTNTADYDVNFDVLLQDVLGKQGLQFVTGGTSNSVIGIIRPLTGFTENTVTATLRALEGVSHVTRNLHGSVSALNNQPVAIQKRGSRNYIKNTPVVVNDGTTTSSVEQGTIDTGFFLSLYPLIVDNDKVRVRLNLGIDELVEIRTVTTGNNTIQLPETTTDSIRMERIITSGDTLILSGVTDNRATSTRTGQGHADNIFLGGNKDAEVRKRKQIILLTAIIDPPAGISEYREKVL